MGAGLLVGTALSVIIPEGMETLNMAYRLAHYVVNIISTYRTQYFKNNWSIFFWHLIYRDISFLRQNNKKMAATSHVHGSAEAHSHEAEPENPVPHLIGVSLVLGFIFMLIVDQVHTPQQVWK